MALRSEAAAAVVVGEVCSRLPSPADKCGARAVFRRPLAVGCCMSWTQGGPDETSPVSYGSLGRESQWLSENFLDLRLRSSSLISSEASCALRRHFEVRDPVMEKEAGSDESSGWQRSMARMQDQMLMGDNEYNAFESSHSAPSASRCSFLEESWC